MKHLFLLALLANLNCHAQMIKPGETFAYNTRLSFHYGLNDSISIPELKGKNIILDLFSSSCIACFKNMPKIQKLQQEYKSELTFLLIGLQDGSVGKVYEKFRSKFSLTLPVAFDSVLISKLGINAFPKYIWINKDGKVWAVTNSDQVTTVNISSFLSGRTSTIVTNPIVSFDRSKPFLVNGNGGADSIFLMRSLLSRWTKNQPTILPADVLPDKSGFQILGATVQQLFMYAAIGSCYWTFNSPLYAKVYDSPLTNHLDPILFTGERFCYSLIGDSITNDSRAIKQTMLQDLERFFGYTAIVEIRKMPCWNLILIGNDTTALSTKFSKFSGTRTYGGIDVRCYPINSLIDQLDAYLPGTTPFINYTGIKGAIDIKLDALMTDLEDLQRALRSNGFQLVAGTTDMKVVVLSRKKAASGYK